MNDKKWTKGPWEVDFQNCHVGQVAVCHGDGDGYWEVWSPNWGGGIDQEANAHLIAAAPELYEALDELADLMQGVIDGDYKPDSYTLQVAKVALAKARGVDNE
jgi:hypothetical protein